MVAHRKNVPTRQAYVPTGWSIVLTVMLCIGGAGWLGLLLVGDSDPSGSPAATTPSISMSPDPTKSTPRPTKKSTTPRPTRTTPSPAETTSPAVRRDSLVTVLNNSGVVGAARAFSAKVAEAGWPVGGIGNWTGSIPANTVYYPPGLQEQAELLGRDVGIGRILPSVAPMRTDRLTIILSGPQ
ncbi:LytR C-terminal domain-containing protein [Aeromicrobium chenweiae]|uniref:Uncharacterized protein n=1 Tax=Aeromicrobium chenweiae TaxID=2079793 RepID=A0A2S0WJ98_9ACTN|nr:LytR C-terminal domain-containing protein [Aeromicrobium chenweiae]AWB91310.1 hypothetical protein C3E78_03210 [Aeromicrobium chenweiae]TGN30564.1 LytR family transcriptional regulator [Aeromicrobium chenweiae]